MKDYTNYIWIFGSLVDIGPKFEPLRPTTLQFHCNSRELRELWKLETPLNCWPTYKKRNHHSPPRQECPKPDSVVLYSNSTKSITTYLTCVMHESIEQMLQQIKQLFLTLTQTKPDRVVFFFFFFERNKSCWVEFQILVQSLCIYLHELLYSGVQLIWKFNSTTTLKKKALFMEMWVSPLDASRR